MKVMLIAPDSMLDWTEFGDAHFVLSRIVDKPRVIDYFFKEQKFKMLDNGCYEFGFPLPFNDLLELAGAVGACEIICPDFFREHEGTYNATVEFLSTITSKERKQFTFCAVPQARDPLDWIGAYREMCELDVNTIAIPIWLSKLYKARPNVVGYLLKKGYWDATKEHHLLGLDNIGECYAYSPGIIRSVDTSLPFSLTHSNIWTTCFGDIEHDRVPLDREKFAPMQGRLLEKHIKDLLEAASYV